MAAMAGEVGIDLGIWLDAAALGRRGGSPYDAPGYTYTPVMAWLLLPFRDRELAMTVWTASSLIGGALAITFVIAAHRRLLAAWRAPPGRCGRRGDSVLQSCACDRALLGQAQLQLVALLSFAVLVATRWPAVSGVAVAIAALLKTWPVVIGVWLLRAGAQHRLRSVLAALVTGGAIMLATVLVLGPGSIATLIARTFGFGSSHGWCTRCGTSPVSGRHRTTPPYRSLKRRCPVRS